LLHIEEITADVIVEIALVEDVIKNLPRPVAFTAAGAFEESQPALGSILPGCRFRLLIVELSSLQSSTTVNRDLAPARLRTPNLVPR
jgi:hypothetical protein